MRALVIGCGRVGSSLARTMHDEGWEVTVVDEDEDSFGRLGEEWRGPLVVGHGMDADVLEEAGIAEADAVLVATDGDNTNVVIAQVARVGYHVPNVAVRILDPARAEFYAGGRDFTVVSPIQSAIAALTDWSRTQATASRHDGAASPEEA
jgi:trk system potassium uptake protein